MISRSIRNTPERIKTRNVKGVITVSYEMRVCSAFWRCNYLLKADSLIDHAPPNENNNDLS